MELVTTQTVVVRSNRITDAMVDGEVVALHIDQGSCFGLNKVGSDIWQLLGKPIAVADICAYIVEKYDVDAETGRTDVLELLQGLLSVGMVETVTTGS